jgi:hypothetical protein
VEEQVFFIQRQGAAAPKVTVPGLQVRTVALLHVRTDLPAAQDEAGNVVGKGTERGRESTLGERHGKPLKKEMFSTPL